MSKYRDSQMKQQSEKLNLKLLELPAFCEQFFTGIEHNTQPSTRLKYANDLKVFFEYIQIKYPQYNNIKFLPIFILDKITTYDIEQFLSYIKSYINPRGKVCKNSRAGVKSKLAAIKSLYRYFYNHQSIKLNPTMLIDIPPIEGKNIVRLNSVQVNKVLDNIENHTYLKQQKSSYKYIKRDYAVISLLLGTGIRVSECAGIDINDICFTDCYIQIVRKGGSEDIVFFSDEVKAALLDYYNERINIIPDETATTAFFLSKRGTRFSVRSIQSLVTKYTKDIKKVSPHKLRATYGTNLYIATKDIYLVADTLGHTNVETTKRYYAEIPNQQKRNARNSVQLRNI